MSEKVILITGTSHGLGYHLANYYAQNGFCVIGVSRTTPENYHFHHFECDITNIDDIKRLISFIKSNYEKIDILINNAGLSSASFLINTSNQNISKVTATNFESVLNLTREAVKVMKKNKFGRIINFSSIHVPLSNVGTSIYSSTKAAIEQFTKVVSKEIISYNITINNLGLSLVKNTGMVDSLPEESLAKLLNQCSYQDLLTVEDVVHAIDFFIDEKSKFITGQTLYTSGV